jgi:hypothetical protein
MGDVLTLFNIDELVNCYMNASTPEQLYSNLLRSQTVIKLSAESVSDLVAGYNRLRDKADKDDLDVVKLYALFVAIVDLAQSIDEVASVDFGFLYWGPEIAQFFYKKD